MSWRIVSMPLDTDEDVVMARRRARQIAAELGFDQQDQTRLATTVSELARNTVSYAERGQIEFELDNSTRPQTLRAVIRDKGAGIANLEAILAGRYRSKTGMGQGILGAKRLMRDFSIETGKGGTTVRIGMRRPRTVAQFAASDLPGLAKTLSTAQPSAYEELKQQNRELLRSLQELTARTDEMGLLTSELESTNRGVVALHSELEATAEELRRASELKTRFLSNMSHEFRTPLNSILALTRLLLDKIDGPLSGEQEKQVRFISDAAAGLTELVNDLLDIAKVEAGKIDVRPSKFSAIELFGALRGLMKPLKISDQVELVFDEPSGVPVLYTDEGKITQILRNFISNALKFTESGEVRVGAVFKEPDRILFSVQDTGIGIAKEFHDRIFEEFEQVPGIFQAQQKGTGLGLPLSRKLAELLHGTIAVVSEPGKGSTFFLDVPARWTAEGVSLVLVESAPDPTRPRVLIADDEEAFRYVMRRMIDTEKYEIIEAADGEEALAAANVSKPDVIVLDINLPKRDGYSVLSELENNERTRGIPVIMSTSLVLSERDRARLSHSRAVLSKATLSTELVSVVLSDALQAVVAS
jgi:signal transduction histidine kinase/CheY-like chemotaxis protein